MRAIASCSFYGLLVGGLLVLATATNAPAQSHIERDLARAERLVVRDRPRAIVALLRIAARQPADPRAVTRYCDLTVPESQATVDALLADESRVRADATRCAELADALPNMEARVRWVHALQGDVGPYIESFREAGLDEGDLAPLRQASALAAYAGDLRLAERALGYAMHVRPQDPAIAHDRALLLLARGDAEGALPLLRRAMRAQPTDARLMRDYAGALLQAGQAEAAIGVFQTLVTSSPNESEAWLSLARARLEAGEHAAAASDAAHALTLADESDGRAALVRGDALRLQGDEVNARTAYEEALRREPRNARARQAISALSAP